MHIVDCAVACPEPAETSARDFHTSAAPPIYGFIHIAMMNHWRQVIDEQFLKMRASGLWDRIERLFLGLLGPMPDDFPYSDPKIVRAHFGEDFTPAERPTLVELQRFCRTHEGLVFYTHTKGVFSQAPGTRDWRRTMEHFILTRHQDCIAALADHDIVGINWHQERNRFFAGNFWWARADYVRSLPDLRTLEFIPGADASPRHICERFVTENPAARVARLHKSPVDQYSREYPRSRYAQVREVPPDALPDCPGAWTGLENEFQDLLEPIVPIARVMVLGIEHGRSLFALSLALPHALLRGCDWRPDGAEAPAHDAPAKQWLEAQLPLFPRVLLCDPDSPALRALDAPLGVLVIDQPMELEQLRRAFKEWEPKIRPSGCLLVSGTEARPDTAGRFFGELSGRKAHIRKAAGLGAWYKPARGSPSGVPL